MDCDSVQCSISAFCHCSRKCLDMCWCTLSSHTKRYASSSPRCRYLTFVLHMVWVVYIEWRFHISTKRTKLKGAHLLGIACSWQPEGCFSVESYRSHAQCWEVSYLLGYQNRTILVVLRYRVWDSTWIHLFHRRLHCLRRNHCRCRRWAYHGLSWRTNSSNQRNGKVFAFIPM